MQLRALAAALFLVLAVLPATADTFEVNPGGGLWSTNGTWTQNGVAATRYPGQLPGTIDTVLGLAATFYTVTVDVTPAEAVTVSFDCPSNTSTCVFSVPSGSTLKLTGTSSVGADARLQLSGGAVVNDGSLTVVSTADLDWTAGTLSGSGLTAIAAGGAVNATGSSMTLSGHALSVAGTFTYGPSASGLQLANGAGITVQNGGTVDVQNSSGIGSNFVGNPSINVLSGGTFIKTNGNFGTNITPVLHNDGLVQTDVNTLVLTSGVHSGTFSMNGAATGIGFSGTPTFQNGTVISGTGTASFAHVTLIGTVAVSNVTMDSFGSISGGTMNLSGVFTWRASSVTGTVLNVLPGGSINITGEANTSLANAAHLNNQGTLTINPGATFSIVSDARITDDGTITIAGDVTIAGDGAPLSRIDVLATRSLSKTAGAGAAHIGVKVNNSGSVSSVAGLLKLQNGGTHSGSWGLGTGAALVFDGGTHQLLGGSISGSTGTVGLTSGTLDVDTAIALPSGIGFQQSGGVLTGSGNVTIPGTFLWTGGSMSNASGNGQTILTGGSSQIAGTTSTLTLSGRTISNTGTFTYNPTPGIELSIDDGGTFLNTGSFNIVGDAEIDSNQSGTPRLTNGSGGAINKSTGTGSADIYAYFSSSSSINITSGSIALHGGGQDLGTVNFNSASNKLIIANGSFSLTTTPGINGAGVLSVDGPFATLALTTAVTVPRMELLGGGTVAGGTLGIGTSLLWREGRMLGGVTNIAGGAVVDATSLTGTITLDSHSLTNGGTFTWDGTTHALQLINGSSLINNATFTATGNGFIGGAAPANAITNNGTFGKTGGTSGTRIDPAFANSGQLSAEVSGQSLIIAGGGSQTGGGSLVTVAGAFIDFFGGTFTVPSGTAPFMGSGIFRVNGGTLSITGNTSVPSPAVLRVDSGTLNVAASVTFQTFGGFQWNGGTLAGDGTTRTFGGSLGGGPLTLDNNHTLTLAGGTISYSGSGLTIGGTANLNIENSATLAMMGGSSIGGTSTDGLTISPGATLDVIAGTSTIGNGSMSGGTIATGAAGRLNIGSGVFTISSGTVSGSGTIGITGGTLTADTNLAIANLVLTAGTLGGTGTITVNGGSWSGGTMSGSGSLTVNSGGGFTIVSGSVKTLGRDFTNLGTVTASDGFAFTGAATATSSGTWNETTPAPIGITCSSCTGRFHNAVGGSYNKTGSPTGHAVRFDNDGGVNASSDLTLAGGGTHSGDFVVQTSGAVLFSSPHTFSATSDTTGTGDVSFLGPVTHQGTIALTGDGTLLVTGTTATLDTAAPVSVPMMFINGNVAGTGAIQLTGGSFDSQWSGGTISGSGAFTVGPSATFRITGSGQALDGRTIASNGTLDFRASIANGASAGAIVSNGVATFAFLSPIAIAPPFTNNGTATFSNQNVTFNGGYTQTGGSTTLAGGSFSSPLTVNLDGGTLIGNGTITANLANDATIAPGTSAGLITINGNYTQSATGTINAEIGGTTPGTQYDRLAVSGAATLGGTINVTLIGGFSPADDDVFDLVTYGSRSGTFATVNLPAFPEGTLGATYESNAFRITADFVGDLAITKTGPATAAFGQNVTFTITVTNNGPSAANGVVVDDPTPTNLTFVSTSGACTTVFPCSLGTIAAGVTKTINATYTVSGGAGTNITNTATVDTTSTDNAAANDVASATVFVELSDLGITKSGPAKAKPGDDITFTITVANGSGSAANSVVVNDPTPAGLTFLSNSGACTTPFPCSLGTMASGTTKTITSKYSISGTLAGSTVTNTATVTTTTSDDASNNTSSAAVAIDCLNDAPSSLSPSSTAGASGTLAWRGRGDRYIVYLGRAGSGCQTEFARTAGNSVPYTNLAPGTYEWRVESLIDGCRTFSSACTTFTVPRDCTVPAAPVARVVGQTTSAKTYDVAWDAVPGATHYAIDEATDPNFTDATRLTVTGTSQSFKHDVTTATAFYYRVFAFTDCVATPGPASSTVRVVIIPLPPKEQKNPSVNVPAGSQEIIVQEVFIPGQAGQNLFFSATTDRPWLTVRPQQGALTPAGITLEVLADPKTLPNGTFTASVIVTITDGTSNIGANGTTTVTTPVTVNLVTPITPVTSKPAASQHALIIPSAGHLGGIDSQWQSDIRVTNAGFRSARYRLTFTPSGGTALGVKQTTITVDAGATTALDDVIRNWFGLGTLGDGANGMLEILPLDDPANTIQSTVASSRTYNVSGAGTLGQYIPAVPFPSFIGRTLPNTVPQILSLQQIAQSSLYRTNVGLAEAAGLPVNAVVSIFNATGAKLAEVPVTLAAGEQRQMNQLLAQHGIELTDGRIEVQVTGGDGKITAYASVVDSGTQDPLLVSGELLGVSGSARYVLPGVANLDNQLASWRTDMRVFNYGGSLQPATLVFYPFNNGEPKSATVMIDAREILTLDNVVKSLFDAENTGGVIQLNTSGPSSLVVTGRTYNQTAEGTFGQFVPAVTPAQAVGAGERTLHILQVEDSTRYRTNVGFAEVTGKAATIEVQVVLPDSKITPTVQIPLAANEFRQFNVIRDLSLGNVYNARITVRVIAGEGRVTAYGSVIDELTQDPTYVPAQ